MNYQLTGNQYQAKLIMELVGLIVVGSAVWLGYLLGQSLLIAFMLAFVTIYVVFLVLETDNNL